MQLEETIRTAAKRFCMMAMMFPPPPPPAPPHSHPPFPDYNRYTGSQTIICYNINYYC